ncbi:hypothetical protein HV205_27515 [Klebsiella sp. RHBSTW-00465]|uniref:hypothetical protein n=1 Tax=Klebsiella sp. RHBSTW-00465 TaxID=2742650 RepID=UPI0015F7078A|nr:hypothetical protein [Klebsiella sp. RHBSTW-00465]MBA7848158.1 hypothetical protein [Klebsiella sp. RHBSTW-00465]
MQHRYLPGGAALTGLQVRAVCGLVARTRRGCFPARATLSRATGSPSSVVW